MAKRTVLTTSFLAAVIAVAQWPAHASPRVQSGGKLQGLYDKYRSAPLEGQNFWHLAPRDLFAGTVYFSCKSVGDITGKSFVLAPNSTWAEYTYKVTRLGATPSEISDPKYPSSRILNREIRFGEMESKIGNGQLSLGGTIIEVEDNGKRMTVLLPFVCEDVECRFDLTESKPSEKLRLIAHRNILYGEHWRHVIDFYQVQADKPTPVIVQMQGGGWGASDKSVTMGIEHAALVNGISFASVNYRFISGAGAGHGHSPMPSRADRLPARPRRTPYTGDTAGSAWLL